MNDIERIQRLRLLDDDFMRVIFQDWNCCQLLLEILLGRNDIKNLYGKSICLDVWIHTNQNETINVEVQRNEKGAHPKRVRYHASLMDTHTSMLHGEFKELEDMYVVSITETNVFKQDLPIYQIERTMKKNRRRFQ